MTRILVVDNYDSFVYNLVQYLAQLGASPEVVRNDEVDLALVGQVDGVLVSPGPGTPKSAGRSIDVIHECAEKGTPMLGVCLGHQALAEAFGAVVSRAPELLHGKTSEVYHQGQGVLASLPNPFTATRYHSLAVEDASVPAELEITARTDSQVIMGIRHRRLPLEGVQFHPESVLTEGGHTMLATWLATCGNEAAAALAAPLAAQLADLQRNAFAGT